MAEDKLIQPNSHDREILNQIEKLLGENLKQVQQIKWNTRGYAVNSAGKVTELGLYYFRIDNKILQELAKLFGSMSNLTKLYLGLNKLTDVSVLGELTNLTQLDLSRNKLTDIFLLGELTNLTQLDLNRNQLVDISVLGKMTNLTQLYLSGNQFTDISVLWKLTNLTQLDLSRNKLTDISVLGKLTNLTRLNLSGNQFADVSVLWKLTNLTQLDLSKNKLTDISVLWKLTNLTQLDLSRTQLTDISVLGKIASLSQLYLNGNQLTDISVLGGMTNLTQLDLSENQLTDISALGELTNLTQLDLSENQLTDISALGELTNLTQLNLSGNRIADITSLDGMKNLRKIFLSNNIIENLSALKGLDNLISIYLGSIVAHTESMIKTAPKGNKITDVSSIKDLKKLELLDLSLNSICDISSLKNIKTLKVLVLCGNQIRDIASLQYLSKLSCLLLGNNPIKKLPFWITENDIKIKWDEHQYANLLQPANNKRYIVLFDNPLETPPVEIIKQGKKAVRNYFESLEGIKPEEVVRLYEAKLLVVGPGDVGKTVFSNRLVYNNVPLTKSTEGIDIHKWPVKTKSIDSFRINLWDFGGQEIYHATHQFFLTKRSLYLFLWEARTDDDRVSFNYWLNVIRLLSDNAPVIMVMTKLDERKKAINQAAIQKQFPNVVGFYEVSAEQDIGIKELRERIIEEIEKLEQIGTTLPKQWVDIREQLEEMKKYGKNYITYKVYQDICCDEHRLNKKQAMHLAGYYHELGIILHFSDNPVLKDIVFLNPEWATDAVYAVTDYKFIKEKHGRFNFDELKGVWKDYPEDKYAALLELMMKFELCFNLEGTKEYIIPELLRPERCSFEWSYQDNLHFQYKYDFMPAGIITRFMVRKHNLIKDDLYWKNGVVMEWEGTTALIEGNEFEGKIDIWIRGEDKKGLLGIIRCDIEYIHETLNRPVMAERIPCICSECKNSTNPHFYNYHDLRTLLRKNIRDTRCMKSAEEISIDVLLGAYGMSEQEIEPCKIGGKDTYNFYGSRVSMGESRYIEVEDDGMYIEESSEPSKAASNDKKNEEPWYKKIQTFIAIICGLILILGFFGIKSCKDISVKKSSSPVISQPNTPSAATQKAISQPKNP
ncbi:MAG: leucine-rich repeat domain-containing protein [Sedimentisphaerales bacterium]